MRVRQVVLMANRERRSWRSAARSVGGRAALVDRGRVVLGFDDLSARTGALETASGSVPAATIALRDDAVALGNEERVTRTGLEGTRGLLREALDMVDRRYLEQGLRARIDPTTEWVRRVELEAEPLLSVVLASRNRKELLAWAVASVQEQAYANWELVVVDDGSTDGTSGLLAELTAGDHRIVVVSQDHRSVGAARNAVLSAAGGEFICYLDDDNLMQPLWLKAVAWAMTRTPDVDLFYGARLTDPEPSAESPATGLPFLHFETWDRDRLEVGNFIDLGVAAHRRNLAEAVFDEHLEMLGDWDLVLRLTADREPMALPVVASLYLTSAPQRITRTGERHASQAAVMAELAAWRFS